MEIGLNEIRKRLNELTEEKAVYTIFRSKLPDMLIGMNEGNGKTYITEIITDTYKEKNLRDFNATDDYLEFTLDGSYKQIENTFNDIDNSRNYSNYFEGVLSFDITKLSNYMNGEQFDLFIDNVKKYSKNATFLLFYDPDLVRNGFVDKLKESLDWFEVYSVSIYNSYELYQIIRDKIDDLGIEVSSDSDEELEVLIDVLIEKYDVQVCRDIDKVINTIVKSVDYYGYSAHINDNSFGKLVNL